MSEVNPLEGMSFEQAFAVARGQAEARQEPQAAPEVPAETPAASAASTSPAEVVVPAQVPAPPTASPPPAVQQPQVPDGLRRILDREAALVEREKALADFETFKRQLKVNPAAALRSIAPDAPLGAVAKALWEEELGDSAPPEAKAKVEVRAVKSDVENLRAQLEAERTRLAEVSSRQQAEAALNQYVGAIQTASKDVPATFPLVKAFSVKHSDDVTGTMLEIAEQHVNRTGEVLTPSELMAQLEKRLEKFQVHSAPAAQAPATVATPASTAPSTLRNSHSQTQPNLAPEDSLDDEVLRKRAFDAVKRAREMRGNA